ncbi:tyrosine-protein kinase hopscotch [Musca vetustissima]|uniref:tyrosine-protein kinase hopscotch n=1 Tax=Musca vetustissima TaxID=27455 RepID=UPI002AB63101|nr:tyrosine-protein kinase hopscotch [Musca vetustissima]
MNQASNASGTTHTTMTILDDGNSSIGSTSILSNGYDFNHEHDHEQDHDTTSNTTISQNSQCYTERMRQSNVPIVDTDIVTHRIYCYRKRVYIEYDHLQLATCEEICIDLSRRLGILPNTRLLFGLRVFDDDNNEQWCLPGQPLSPGVVYCFRMRFKVPLIDGQLQSMDPNAYEYLYNQMRYDMVHECIPSIRYPRKKDNVMGLGAVDMYIDYLEQRGTVERIESNYKRYLPRPLVKAHIFVKRKICNSFRSLRQRNIELVRVKWNYVLELNNLAPDYLLETFAGFVDFIPGDILATVPNDGGGDGGGGQIQSSSTTVKVCIKLDLFDSPEPGLKVARRTCKDTLEWVLVSKLENIYAVYTRGVSPNTINCRLEITGMPNGYRIEFDSKIQLEAFISYLSGYMRLTTKWMVNLCMQYVTPSLEELMTLHCHGPIGGAFSFAKIREQGDKCGSYIIRQCEKEYDTYYIDINTKSISEGLQPLKFKTETFKITKKVNLTNTSPCVRTVKWILHYNGSMEAFDKLTDLAKFIPTESDRKFRISPSDNDRSPLLLICLPKNVQSKKTEKELSEAELQRERVKILDLSKDLQWYHNSSRECDNGRMIKMKADWIQNDGYKDVTVTLKVLKFEDDFPLFRSLANTLSRIQSPHIIKLFGITLDSPYTMVMEYSEFGPLNKFLMDNSAKVSLRQLIDVVYGLARGLFYLRNHHIVHGYLRCSNLYVTKFDPKTNLLEAKISGPGFPRPYRKDEIPWIPFEYHRNLNAAKNDPDIDIWAFGTTVWEIFARGEPIGNKTTEMLRQNLNKCGGILEKPKDCPEEMFKVMMDGWNTDPEINFDYMQILRHLIAAQEALSDKSSSTNDVNVDENIEVELKETANDHARHHNGFANESNVFSFPSYFNATNSVLEIPNGKVIFRQRIGEGHYGTVHLGEVRYNSPNNAREYVAIKTLKSARAPQLSYDFMREIEIMESLDHPNIVKIKHWIQRPFCIIMEYLESGSFLVYLTSKKPNLTNEILLGFALDIAKGMDYLASKNIIHRDLAARNILVDRDSVKISDFGLAQRADSDGYYVAHSSREIPIKWYAPEAIRRDAKFSSQSDVWSYGVTLFEMFSRGESPNLDPNIDLTQDEFLMRLERGDRLRKPNLCPNNVYERLMKPCWDANPKMRPTFREIIGVIQSINNESISTIPKSDFNISPPTSPTSLN